MSEEPGVARSGQLTADFAAAARLLRHGAGPEAAAMLLPPHLADNELGCGSTS